MNGNKIVQRKILYQITPLKFWLKNIIAELWAWMHVSGGGGKDINANERFEPKINAGFVFSVSELVEKSSFLNFLISFLLEKKLQFCSKKSISSTVAIFILICTKIFITRGF